MKRNRKAVCVRLSSGIYTGFLEVLATGVRQMCIPAIIFLFGHSSKDGHLYCSWCPTFMGMKAARAYSIRAAKGVVSPLVTVMHSTSLTTDRWK